MIFEWFLRLEPDSNPQTRSLQRSSKTYLSLFVRKYHRVYPTWGIWRSFGSQVKLNLLQTHEYKAYKIILATYIWTIIISNIYLWRYSVPWLSFTIFSVGLKRRKAFFILEIEVLNKLLIYDILFIKFQFWYYFEPCEQLQHNQITEWKMGYFERESRVRKLDLSYNNLTEIPENGFYGINGLNALKLDHNLLTEGTGLNLSL